MPEPVTLGEFLHAWAGRDPLREAISKTVRALSGASLAISDLVARGSLAGALGKGTGKIGEIDEQKEIDVLANQRVIAAVETAPVAALASEELDEPLALDSTAPLLVAVDPLDGSSNVEANVSIGMIFTVLPAPRGLSGENAFLQPGTRQLAAGFVVLGPQTALVLTVGDGTQIFTLDRHSGAFLLTHPRVAIPRNTQEYAINSSNARHWEEPIRTYIHDCENGTDGPRGFDYNMRWTGSPVADIYRILSRGGIYLYPGDRRKNFGNGRLRLIYEATPIAWVVEQAGGTATNGSDRVLNVVPRRLHERTPLIAGSSAEVELVKRYYDESKFAERSPLFGRRGLFR